MLIKIFFITVLILIVLLVSVTISFKHETYFKMTGNNYFKTIFDVGRYGEYLSYKKLKAYELDGGKFLFNCYLPKDDDTTTEIDVMLIHSTGIFVIESKNYSGWIFGSEQNKTWTQTLHIGKGNIKKEHFYNPIMQNNTHIKWLRKIVGNHVPIYSLIVFSERCTLKDITVENPDVMVINRQHINIAVKNMGNRSIQALSRMDIARIHEMLYPYTQTTEYEKQKHIDNIEAKHKIKKYPIHNITDEPSDKTNDADSFDSNLKQIDNEAAESKKAIEESIGDKSTTEITTKQNESIEETQNMEKENVTDQSINQICPRCGAELILRTATKGEHAGEQFYGCSRFPKCRYTKALEKNHSIYQL